MFEIPCESDWPVVLQLANESVADVAGAGPQDEWLANRRAGCEGGVRSHFVVRDSGSGEVRGYGAVEHPAGAADGAFRIFVVTRPEALEQLGSRLLDHAWGELRRLGARTAWLTEFASDARLLAFLDARGFEEVRRFDWRGSELIVVEKSVV